MSGTDPGLESHQLNGSTLKNEGQLNKSTKSPPPIPHISNNIIPLSNILKFYTQEAYKQLLTIIENLSSTVESESDSNRKKKFLTAIISLRQDFIKIYTLVKWAQNSKDVSKLIDLLNFLRSQDFYFEQLGFGLNELNRYLGAQLPNSDLLSSLEILIKGRPQLPSYNLIKPLKISTEKTLEVLQDLNLILTTRMALIDDLPKRFMNNYTIKDGRVIFTIPNEFEVAITVANDLIIDKIEDYYQSPFFFISFKFLFGINPDTSLITHKDNKIATKLPQKSHENLERIINQVLLKQGLKGLYDTLHKYSISFKLYLIARQLKELSTNSKWKNSIQFKYQSSLIIINYWSSHYLSRNWKSFIELGIDKNYNLNFRWFKNGRYSTDHHNKDSEKDSTGMFSESIPGFNSNDDEEDLSVDLILNIIINKHSESSISNIYSKLLELLPEDSCSILSPHQLLLNLTPTKKTIFAINPLTGFFYFMDPSPIQNYITKRINSQPSIIKNKNFITEDDMMNNVVSNLIQLKLETLNKEINNKLITTEWISNNIIHLNDLETLKLFEFDINEKEQSNNKIQFYRCKNWPSSWFLINLIAGLTSKTYWWVARIKSIKGEWKIQWVEKLKVNDDLSYEFFDDLSITCSNKIIDHMITEELQIRSSRFLKVEKNATDVFKLPLDKNIDTNTIYESIIMIHNHGEFLPLSNSSNSLFLLVKLTNTNNVTQMNLRLMGHIKNLPLNDNSNDDFSKLSLLFKKDMFEIVDLIDLTSRMNDSEHDNSNNKLLLDNLFNNLNKLNQLIKLLEQLNKTNIEIIQNQINEISIKINPIYSTFKLVLPEQENGSITILTDKDELNEVKIMVKFLNQNSIEKKNTMIGSIKYLQELVPILKALRAIQTHLIINNSMKLSNGLQKLQFDTRLENLNTIQFVYTINSINPSNPKKVAKDRISLCLNFKMNKFAKKEKLLIRLSMKDNLNSRNLKFKKLFESIFKSINEFDASLSSVNNTNGSTNGSVNGKTPTTTLMKFNYDYLLDSILLEDMMMRIADCFLNYFANN